MSDPTREQHAQRLHEMAKLWWSTIDATDKDALIAAAAALRAPVSAPETTKNDARLATASAPQSTADPRADRPVIPLMTEPTFDEGGDYPSDETLEALRTWPITHANAGLDFLAKAWHWPDFGVSHELRPYEAEAVHAEPGERFLRLATGGWSGNEELIGACDQNFTFGAMWRLSASGGLSIYQYFIRDEDGNQAATQSSGIDRGSAAQKNPSPPETQE